MGDRNEPALKGQTAVSINVNQNGVQTLSFETELICPKCKLIKENIYFFTIPFDKQRKNLLRLRNKIKSFFANTDFICEVLL